MIAIQPSQLFLLIKEMKEQRRLMRAINQNQYFQEMHDLRVKISLLDSILLSGGIDNLVDKTKYNTTKILADKKFIKEAEEE